MNESNLDSRWAGLPRPIEPRSHSRLADNNSPDCPDAPPDDPYAATRSAKLGYYDAIAKTDAVEQLDYLNFLPRTADGSVKVSPATANELALLHNREFQTRFEQVYLLALNVSANLFEFETQWDLTNATQFSAANTVLGDSRLLSIVSGLGFEKQLMRSGQLAVNLLNSFSWQFQGGNVSSAGGNIVAALTLPLLRGAGRYVRMENLVQAERSLLYEARLFAQFRRQFYLSVYSNYLQLLGQIQGIRNAQSNLNSLELNLLEHRELQKQELVSQIQVDQVFQDYQSGRIALLSAEQQYSNSLDQFKLLLGLPVWVEIEVDENLLVPFKLNSDEIQLLQTEIQQLYTSLITYLPPNVPTAENLKQYFQTYRNLQENLVEYLPNLEEQIANWNSTLQTSQPPESDVDDSLDWSQQNQIAERLTRSIKELSRSAQEDLAGMDEFKEQLFDKEDDSYSTEELSKIWNTLTKRLVKRLQTQAGEAYVFEIQTRIFVVEIPATEITQDVAIQFAHENRLDLMNGKALVSDAFRRTEVAAQNLDSQLDINASANLGSDSNRTNAFRFDSSSNTYNLGFTFDGPLNRFNERNIYRQSQIEYQRARRQFIQIEDGVTATIRADLRNLDIQRLNFQIARQQLLAATRQVEIAQINLRGSGNPSSNLTRDLLQALQGLLVSKNNLIGSWLNYQVARVNLFVDLEYLYLDGEGNWINQNDDFRELESFLQSESPIQAIAEAYQLKNSPIFPLNEDEAPIGNPESTSPSSAIEQ